MVLAIGLLGVMRVMNYGHRGTQKDFRSVTALQILQDRTNRLSQVPYASWTTQIPGTSVTLGAPVYGIPLGAEAEAGVTYTVSCTLTRIPVRMRYRQIDVTVTPPDFDPDDSKTWRFSAVTTADGTFNGSSADNPYKIIRLQVVVQWNSVIGNVSKTYEAVTFVVDLEN